LIRHRRSVYPIQYSGEKIKREIILEMLENANWAPTHKLTEPWRFTVFAGKGLKKLADFSAGLYKEHAMRYGIFSDKKYDKIRNKPLLASHVIAIGMKRDEEKRLPEVEEIESVACAVQNMWLTATAYGVGCYGSSGGVTYNKGAGTFFGLNGEDKLLGFLFLGMPKKELPAGRRGPVNEKVTWVE
jgi:nitroreductase